MKLNKLLFFYLDLPSAILQRPFFDADQPSYLNYGGIGQIIGHEVTHNFDDGGRQFDLNGNLVDWWQKDSQKTFSSKADCFTQQWFRYLDRIDPGRTVGFHITFRSFYFCSFIY